MRKTLRTERAINLLIPSKKSESLLDMAVNGDFAMEIEKVNQYEAIFAEYDKQVAEAKRLANSLLIESEEDAAFAIELAGNFRKLEKRLEAGKKEVCAPARDFINNVTALAKPVITDCQEAIAMISAKHSRYIKAKQAQAELQAIQQSAIEELVGVDTTVDITPVKVNTSVVNATTRQHTVIKIELLDKSQVPLEFLELNEQAVKQAVKMGRMDFPGLKIVEEKQTVIVTK